MGLIYRKVNPTPALPLISQLDTHRYALLALKEIRGSPCSSQTRLSNRLWCLKSAQPRHGPFVGEMKAGS